MTGYLIPSSCPNLSWSQECRNCFPGVCLDQNPGRVYTAQWPTCRLSFDCAGSAVGFLPRHQLCERSRVRPAAFPRLDFFFFFWTCLTRPSAPRVLLQVGVWSASGLQSRVPGRGRVPRGGGGGCHLLVFLLASAAPRDRHRAGVLRGCTTERGVPVPPSLKANSEQRCLPPEEEAAGAPPDAEQAVPGATGRGHRGCSPGGGSQRPHGLGECPTGRSGTSAGCGPRPPPPDGMAPAIA